MGVITPGNPGGGGPIGANAANNFPTFAPPMLPNCVLWLRADIGTTIATGVSQWNDQSGNGNNFSQATGSAQPTVAASVSALNGAPALQFAAASSQQLSLTSFAGVSAQPFTVYCVALFTGTLASGGVVFGFGTGGVGGIIRNNSGTPPIVTADTGPYSAQVNSAQSPASPFVASTIFQGATSSLRTNDVAATGTLGTGGISGSAAIGTDNAGGPFWAGYIAEVIVYSSTSALNSTVLAYLSARYGLTA